MQDVAVLWERSRAPRMTVISSSLRSPPNPYSVPWMSSMAFSCDLLNSACRPKSSRMDSHSSVHTENIIGSLTFERWWAGAWGQKLLLLLELGIQCGPRAQWHPWQEGNYAKHALDGVHGCCHMTHRLLMAQQGVQDL